MSNYSISVEKAKQLAKAYREGGASLPDGRTKTRSVWFSLEQLTSFINKLNNLRDAEGIDGVRFIFGKYTAETVDQETKHLVGCNTLIYVATKKKDGGAGHIDHIKKKKSLSYENRGHPCPPFPGCEEVDSI